MILFRFLIIMISILLWTELARCANPAEEGMNEPGNKFKQALESDDNSAKATPNSSLKDPEIEQLATTLDVDYQTAFDYKNILDPFEQKLPIVVTEKPSQAPIPTPENPTPTVAPPPQFKVSGMVWNTKAPTAIVNGSIVKVGDQVSNWAVTEISKDGVRVRSEERELIIKPIINPTAQNTNP